MAVLPVFKGSAVGRDPSYEVRSEPGGVTEVGNQAGNGQQPGQDEGNREGVPSSAKPQSIDEQADGCASDRCDQHGADVPNEIHVPFPPRNGLIDPVGNGA